MSYSYLIRWGSWAIPFRCFVSTYVYILISSSCSVSAARSQESWAYLPIGTLIAAWFLPSILCNLFTLFLSSKSHLIRQAWANSYIEQERIDITSKSYLRHQGGTYSINLYFVFYRSLTKLRWCCIHTDRLKTDCRHVSRPVLSSPAIYPDHVITFCRSIISN